MSAFSIAIVSPRLPSPVGKADSRTVYNMIDYFAGRGHAVHLASFAAPGSSSTEAEKRLRDRCATTRFVPLRKGKSRLKVAAGVLSPDPMQVRYYQYSDMQDAVDDMIAEASPDVAYSHLIRTAEYVADRPDVRTVLGMQISQTLNYRRMIERADAWWARALYYVEHKKVKRYEPSVARRFDRVLIISPHDKRAVDPEDELSNVFFNPHGVEVEHYAEDTGVEKRPKTIVMNADFEAPTNVDAATFFYEKIFPTVREAVPGAELVLAGRNPARPVRKMAEDPAVTVTGFVDEMRPYLQQASVSIDPLRIGAGMQNKVLVSMAAGTPVVATHMANEGLQIPPEEGVLFADEPGPFAQHVVNLLGNPERRKRLGQRGQAYVRKYWTWDFHFSHLESMIDRLLEKGPDAPVQQYAARSLAPA